MERPTYEQIQRRERGQRTTPSQRRHQPLADRPEHGRCEARYQCQRRDGFARIGAEAAIDHGEGRLVERGGHAHPQPGPHEKNHAQRPGPTQQCEQRRGCERSPRHERASAVAIDKDPCRQSGHACDQQADGKGPHNARPMPAQFVLDGREQQRKRVVERSPRDDLRDAERPHQWPAGPAIGQTRRRSQARGHAAAGLRCGNQCVVRLQSSTSISITGTSISTPTTVASAAPETPNSIIAVAMATSKWFEAPIIAAARRCRTTASARASP